MKLQSSYPVLMVDDPIRSAAFYTEHFGFEETFAVDWYVSLRHSQNPASELAFIKADHETIPASHRATARGILVNLEVEDAAGEYERLVGEGGMKAMLELKDEAFGQRHFIVADPAGNLVDVIENIPPSGEFIAAYS